MSNTENRAKLLAVLDSWLNWEEETDLCGLLLGIADYSMELHLLEDEMGLPRTRVTDLIRWNGVKQPSGLQGRIGPSSIDLALQGSNMTMMITPRYTEMVQPPVFNTTAEAFTFYTSAKAVLRLHARTVSMPAGELDGRQAVLDNQMWEAMSSLQDAANEQDGCSHNVEEVCLPEGVTFNGSKTFEMER